MADDVLIRPVIRPTSVGIRCEAARLYAEIPEVDEAGNILGSMVNVEIDLADPAIPPAARDALVRAVKGMVRFRGVIS